MDEKQLSEQKDIDKGHKPRILYYDLEISPLLTWTYKAWDSNAIKIEQPQKIISFAYQWEGEKTVHCKVLSDYEGYKPDKFNIDDEAIIRDLYDVMEQADLLVGHNSNGFDYKHANARFLYYEMNPLPQQKFSDSLKMARKYFKMPKNNLGEVYYYLFHKEGKTKVTHADILWDYLDGDEKAHKQMREYNKRDIVITKAIYERMRPFDKSHPNMNFFMRDGMRCKACTSKKLERQHQSLYLRISKRMRYVCLDCGHNNYGEALKEGVEKVKTF